MSKQQRFAIIALALVAIIVYLFASAPGELPDEDASASGGKLIPIETVMRIIAKENDVARALYTGEIVGPGQKAGLAFSEHWRDNDVEAGPLPALFLRETSASLESNPVELGLFLGSEFPIAASNRFSAEQMKEFEVIKTSNDATFFLDSDTQLYTAMYPDYASVMPCVTCHNEHPDSPKTDWVLDDIMGATTWTYAKAAVNHEEALRILAALRQGFADAYVAYIEKARTFASPPVIGEQWPRDGYFLPAPDVFLAEFERRASGASIGTLLVAIGDS